MIDLHCHILPGLDDGARSLEEAIAMARIAQADGITKVVATPHFFRGFANEDNGDLIQSKQNELCQALADQKIQLEVFRGAEVHIAHNLFEEIRRRKDELVLNHSSYLFLEFPSDHVYPAVKNLFFDIMNEGLIPIIAHPERNSVFIQNPVILYELIQMGGLAQANRGSFSGLYGSRTQEAASRFLSLNLIHFIATDGHNAHAGAPVLREAFERAASILGEASAKMLVEGNPGAVLEDRDLPYHPQPLSPRETRKSLNLKIPAFARRQK